MTARNLDAMEIRVLSVLIEKALTQSGGYPMTLNGILLACNQKQNREPVVEYTEAEVGRTLHGLQLKGLVRQVPPAIGARANRFAHQVVEVMGWDRREQAIMAELMLRGRQTAGELRTHASRMCLFPDLESVLTVLGRSVEREPPQVRELPREPGRSATRFQHLLGRESSPAPEEAGGTGAGVEDIPVEVSEPALARLEERVALLERRLAELEERRQEDGTGPGHHEHRDG